MRWQTRADNSSTDCMAVGDGWSNLFRHESQIGPYWDGCVVTQHGIVTVYQQIDTTADRNDHTNLGFVLDGFHYMRTISQYYSPRYTKTLAKRFAEEIVKAHRTTNLQVRYEELERQGLEASFG